MFKGLFALAPANTGERFGYYTMLAIFLLFIQVKFGFTAAVAGQIYAIFISYDGLLIRIISNRQLSEFNPPAALDESPAQHQLDNIAVSMRHFRHRDAFPARET